MTATERRQLRAFTKHVNKKLTSIERNIRTMIVLHKFEVDQLKAQLKEARQPPRRGKTFRARRCLRKP
jgi:hypothetical protein